MEFFQENWLPVLVAIYLLGMVLYGHYRGFIRLVVSCTAMIITLLAVRLALPYVTDYAMKNTTIRETIGNTILQAVGADGKETHPMPDEQRMIIENLKLPDSVKEALLSNNNSRGFCRLYRRVFIRDAYQGSLLYFAVCSNIDIPEDYDKMAESAVQTSYYPWAESAGRSCIGGDTGTSVYLGSVYDPSGLCQYKSWNYNNGAD